MADARLCAVEGCGKKRLAREWCSMHYQRWAKHGDPLKCETTIGKRKAQRFYRDVVLAYDGEECLIWPFAKIRGYGAILVDNQKQIVSRLLCAAEHGPAPSPEMEAAHSCGRGHEGCVTRRHVSWKTPVENAADKELHGTVSRGDRHGFAKLNESDVRSIRALKGQKSIAALGRMFGVSPSSIRQVFNGKAWGWVE